MPAFAHATKPSGSLVARILPKDGFYAKGLPDDLPLKYRLRTYWKEFTLRLRLGVKGAYRGFVEATGILAVCRLYISVIRKNGDIEHYGLVGTKVITDAGVAYLVDDWDGGSNVIDNFNYHGIGTGSTAEAAGDTALVTESTTALNPDNTRATGTKSQPSANIARTVGTLTADAQIVVREHGIFSQAATGGGTLWDRTVFSTITLESGDSLQATHSTTFSSGG